MQTDKYRAIPITLACICVVSKIRLYATSHNGKASAVGWPCVVVSVRDRACCSVLGGVVWCGACGRTCGVVLRSKCAIGMHINDERLIVSVLSSKSARTRRCMQCPV
jgi:hypothetical protein